MILSILFSLYLIISSGHLKDPSQKTASSQLLFDAPAAGFDPCMELVKKELASNNWKAALKTLQRTEGNESCFDTQVAFSLIDQVINNDAYEHYPYAEHLYFQSLKNDGDNKHIELIKNEALKLLPLLAEDEKKRWTTKIELDDKTLTDDIKAFWTFQDPIQSTSTNERLMEHWQRISDARKKFSRNDESVYGSDDRGTIYVKYGAPSFKRSGTLFPDNTEIRSKLYDLSFFKGGINPREMFNLNMSIKQQYMPKYYEVWVYRNLGSRRPILFIFGESANSGTFGLRESVEEFISSGSFRMGISSSYNFGTGPRGLTAGPFLQMALYNKLSTIDIYFGNQLSYYDQNWLKYMNGNLNFSSFKMLNSPHRAERELDRIQEQAPHAQSTFKRRLGYIDQSHKVFRFLNNQNEPVTNLIIFSSPHKKLVLNDKLVHQHENPTYKIEHTAKVLGKVAEETYTAKTEFMLGNKLVAAQGNVLEIPVHRLSINMGYNTVLISSELSRIIPDDIQEQTNSTIIASVVNKLEELAPPLKTDKAKLEVSDVIWGYTPGNINHDIENISFTIPEGSQIPKGKNLMTYFEVYHLNADSKKLHNYQVEYFINRIKRRRTLDTGIKLTLNFSSVKPTAKEHLEIETSSLDPGKYRAVFQFSERSSTTPFAERFIEFTINKETQ